MFSLEAGFHILSSKGERGGSEFMDVFSNAVEKVRAIVAENPTVLRCHIIYNQWC
jgi:hypothetical protein